MAYVRPRQRPALLLLSVQGWFYNRFDTSGNVAYFVLATSNRVLKQSFLRCAQLQGRRRR